jgi:hypothetical protein
MSQASTKETNPPSKKPYHSPQLQKFGKVSELTLANASVAGTTDNGTYAS